MSKGKFKNKLLQSDNTDTDNSNFSNDNGK